MVAGAVVPGSNVAVEGIYQGPARLGYVGVLERMGAQITVTTAADGTATIAATAKEPGAPPLQATTVAAAEIPSLDEIPALAVAAAMAHGTTVFHDVGELRVKEVDRLQAVIDMVTAFGARADADGDTLSITGVAGASGSAHLRGARFDSRGDHRMAMAAAVAALAAAPGERSLLTGFGAVATSYPGFADDLARLTGTGPPRTPRPHHRHRRTGRRRQIHGLARRGRRTRSRPARYGSDVPRRRRPGPGPRHRPRRP